MIGKRDGIQTGNIYPFIKSRLLHQFFEIQKIGIVIEEFHAISLSFVQSQRAHVLDNIGEMMLKRIVIKVVITCNTIK
ncbi:hypothetical protein [Bacillus cereus]|uniref:hypothetical protein n=1 Tax=Bacillus cereus TaxID=1396 RepID=UPI0028524EA6|nr:hypothetical protein [Bacillus cereus]WLE91064.1 hypothetical protein GGBNIMDK_00095 [Bacillus cereus]